VNVEISPRRRHPYREKLNNPSRQEQMMDCIGNFARHDQEILSQLPLLVVDRSTTDGGPPFCCAPLADVPSAAKLPNVDYVP
jgi:hypothetical protein